MSSHWQWQDGHGAGHLQRVTNSAAYNRAQKTRRAYTEHQKTCGNEACPAGCPEAQKLWQARLDADGESTQ